MTNTKSGFEIFGIVEHVSQGCIWVKYRHGDEIFRIEMPRTEFNRNLKLHDRVEFALLRLVEEKK